MPEVKLSNPDKVLFPEDGITKAELAEHYARVAELMVPHCKDRPMNLWRWNKGIDHDVVVQQSLPKGAPDWVARCEVPRRKGGDIVHGMINDADTLRWLAQQNCITPHVWNSRCDKRDRPTGSSSTSIPPARTSTRCARARWRWPSCCASSASCRSRRSPARAGSTSSPRSSARAPPTRSARGAQVLADRDRRGAPGHADDRLAQGEARRPDPRRRRPQHLRADGRRALRRARAARARRWRCR